jgi:hypothetical protein
VDSAMVRCVDFDILFVVRAANQLVELIE